MDTPSHWLRPNEQTRLPRTYICLDTEATEARNNGTGVQTWRLAVTCCDRRSKHTGKPMDTEWATHAEPSQLWNWVTERCRKRQRTILVAHNLAYDLRISQAFDILPSMGWAIDAMKLDAGSAWVRWRNDGRTLVMVDSVSWLPMGLAKLGVLVGMTKPELPAWSDGDDEWEARCKADVTILRECWLRLMSWIEKDDLGNWKPTGAGQALASFRHRFMEHRILVHNDPCAKHAERTAAWTGRCEAWRHGELSGGPWTEWDYGLAYTQVAATCDLPLRLHTHVAKLNANQYKTVSERYRVLANVTVTTNQPVVPAKSEHGIYWPTGTFNTVLWDTEINELARTFATITINEAWLYVKAPVLKQWALWILGILHAPAGTVDPIVSVAAKHWSRALIGRLGSRWSQWDAFGESPYTDVRLWSAFDRSTGERFKMMQAGTQVMRSSVATEPPDGLPQIMSYVMAECRVRLWRAMVLAGLENIAYVDTDGLYVNEEGSRRLEEAGLSGLRRKGKWERLTVMGPRQLVRDGALKMAGVATNAHHVGGNRFMATIWRQLTTSMALGESNCVTLLDRTVRVQGTDHRRQHLPNNRTAAYWLNG